MKVAIAHDSLTQLGGAERVLEDLHSIFPKSPVFVLVKSKRLNNIYKDWEVRTSPLQSFYNIFPKLQYYLPVIPSAVRSLRFKDFDVVLSSSSSFIKNITVPKDTRHVCYCHTPTRFLWSDFDYVDQEVPFLLKPLARMFLSWMKKWDYKGAQRVDFFIANSKEVQRRIKQYYNRDSVVIYPGIDVNFWHPVQYSPSRIGDELRAAGGGGMSKSDYFLIAGRLHAHKHNELIVEIFNELGLPLHVVGTGRQEKYLRSIAKSNITFYGRVSDEELREQYSGALGFIYPQIEDAGLMPLEAAACGTASIGIAKGGSLETIVPGVTGELFGVGSTPSVSLRESASDRSNLLTDDEIASVQDDPGQARNDTMEKWKREIKQIIQNWKPEKYTLENLRQHAERFSNERFKQQIEDFISKLN